MIRRTRAAARLLLAALSLATLRPWALAQVPEAAREDARIDASVETSLLLFPPIIQGGDSDQAAAFGAALGEALGAALADASFMVSRTEEALEPDAELPAQASSRALAAGAGWAAVVTLELADKRLAYTLRVYDAREAALAASAGFSAFAGISSLPLFDDSARTVAAKAAAWRSSAERGAPGAVPYRLTVSSPDEGAAVSISGPGIEGSREMGTIAAGSLSLPYIPFERGVTVTVRISQPGMKTLDLPIELGAEAPDIRAPALRKVERENLLVGTGPGRLIGLGVTYRYYFRPEWAFLFFNDRLFAGYDFSPGSRPLLHLETWEGIGAYLFFPPESPFRMGACVGGGFLFSLSSATPTDQGSSAFVDVALIPMEVFLEYRKKDWPTIWLSYRGAYSINAAGLIGRGWMGGGQPDLSVGLMWRR